MTLAISHLRVDHQAPMPTPAVMLAGSSSPWLSWSADGPSTPLTVTVTGRDGRTVFSDEVSSAETGVTIPLLGPYDTFRAVVSSEGVELAVVAFDTGPLELSDWEASWLEVPAGRALSQEFTLDETPSVARLHVTAQGLVVIAVNGETLNGDRVDPSRTDATRALYRTFDIAPLLHHGVNTVDYLLGSGEWHRTERSPRLLAQLDLLMVDGTERRIAPDERSPLWDVGVESEEQFYLERIRDGERTPTAEPVHALAAGDGLAAPPDSVLPDTGPLVRAVKSFVPTEIARGDGWRTFDVGVNVAGRSVVTVDGVSPGSPVGVIHGEWIDAAGHVDTTNITMPYDVGRARQVVERIAASGQVTVRPLFTYHGFRYLEVAGVPEVATVTVSADAIHSDLARAAKLRVTDPMISTLLERAERTALNNVHGVPEDCPTREQSAWTGDMASAAEYLFAAFDMAAFADKWLADLATSQAADGRIPAVAPDLRDERVPGEPAWCAALHRFVAQHWLHVGDRALVRRMLPTLRAWVDYQLSRIGDTGIVDGFDISYGQDWLGLEQTPAELIHTAAVIESLDTLVWLEREMDGLSDQRLVHTVAALRADARTVFVDDARGTAGSGSQGSLAAALTSGILPEELRSVVIEALADRIVEAGYRATTGFALTHALVQALSDGGRDDLIVSMLRQPAQPGIGAMLVDGPGTFWENWFTDRANTGTGSLDHLGLGAPFAGWAWQRVGGTRPVAAGWSRIRIDPAVGIGVDDASFERVTPHGLVKVAWRRQGDEVQLDITIPHGITAEVALLDAASREIGPGRHLVRTAVPRRADPRTGSAKGDWKLPSVAPAAVDVVGRRDLLDGVLSQLSRAIPFADNEATRHEPLRCMPVPHAQTGLPTLLVSGRTPAVGVTMTFEQPLSLAGARFVYVLIDDCGTASPEPSQRLLALQLADGRTVEASGRRWPASVNRIIVDVTDIDTDLTAVEVRLDLDETGAPARREHQVGFHVTELGISTARPTW